MHVCDSHLWIDVALESWCGVDTRNRLQSEKKGKGTQTKLEGMSFNDCMEEKEPGKDRGQGEKGE